MKVRKKPRVLVIDDEEGVRASLRMILEYEGFECLDAGSGKQGLERAAAHEPDAILLDIKMQGMDGLETLQLLSERHPEIPVIMISGHGTVETAVEATRMGAFDFMEKPLESDRVLLVLRNAFERRRLQEENRDLRTTVSDRYRMIGESAALATVHAAVAKAAPTRASVLITGESGSGKELVARAVHQCSTRAEHPFIKVNCAAIPEDLIESELFGHTKGSFTGAVADQVGKFVEADGGTLFLDEVGDMSLRTQSKVLRALQDGEIEPVGAGGSVHVDVRVLAATNKDLAREIEEGRFREDLYFRLNVIPIVVPPLRDRAEDISRLIEYFAEQFHLENDLRAKKFSRKALDLLAGMPWRGNVRELRNVIERLLIMSPGETIEATDLPSEPGLAPVDAAPLSGDAVRLDSRGVGLQAFKDAAEKAYLLNKLEEHDWNIAATAKAIETPRSNLYKKLDAYGIRKNRVATGDS